MCWYSIEIPSTIDVTISENYVSECTFADKQLCNMNTTGFGQHSISISYWRRVFKTKIQQLKLNWFQCDENELEETLTISPSSPPKSKNSKRTLSSAEAFNLSNEYDQTTLAGGPKPLSTSENPRSRCTISWHGRPWKIKPNHLYFPFCSNIFRSIHFQSMSNKIKSNEKCSTSEICAFSLPCRNKCNKRSDDI